jgi:hypothetical protein
MKLAIRASVKPGTVWTESERGRVSSSGANAFREQLKRNTRIWAWSRIRWENWQCLKVKLHYLSANNEFWEELYVYFLLHVSMYTGQQN